MFSLVNFCPLRLLSWTLSSQSGVHRERMLKALTLGFPVGSVVKNLSADAGSIQPMLGSNEAHTPQLLSLFVLWSLGVTTTEPTNPNYWSPCPLGPILLNKISHYNTSLCMQLESSLRLLRLEKACAARETQRGQKDRKEALTSPWIGTGEICLWFLARCWVQAMRKDMLIALFASRIIMIYSSWIC